MPKKITNKSESEIKPDKTKKNTSKSTETKNPKPKPKVRNYVLAIKKTGEFEIESGSILICDPYFNPPYDNVDPEEDPSIWGILKQVIKGKYVSYIRYTNVFQIGLFFAFHESIDLRKEIMNLKWIECKFPVKSVTGEFGIFDLKHFRQDDDSYGVFKGDYNNTSRDGDRWCGMCVNRTNSGKYAGVIPYGAVINIRELGTTYKAYCVKNDKKKVIAIKIVINEPELSILHNGMEDLKDDIMRKIPNVYRPKVDYIDPIVQYTVTAKYIDKKVYD